MAETIFHRVTDGQKFDPNDHYIAVMGVTGSGKSQFISRATGQEVKTNRGLLSCTMDVALYEMTYKGERVWLIDTPGFNDTLRSDTEILRGIASWLGRAFKSKIQLSGLVYLHKITDNRMDGATYKNLKSFRGLVGKENMGNVILITTMWAHVPEAEGDFREDELIRRPEFWGKMQEAGSQMRRHADNHESAMRILGLLLDKKTKVVLAIQTEMANGMSLEDTEAGKVLSKELEDERKRWQKAIEEVKQDAQLAKDKSDQDQIEILFEQQAVYEEKLEQSNKERQALNVSLNRLLEDQAAQFAKESAKHTTEIALLKSAQLDRESEISLLKLAAKKQAHDQQSVAGPVVPRPNIAGLPAPNSDVTSSALNQHKHSSKAELLASLGMGLSVGATLSQLCNIM